MGEDFIPEAVRRFLLMNIDSIAEWEGLLLLRAHPNKAWSAHEASRNLYISEDAAAVLLAALVARGMAAAKNLPDGKIYKYKPASSELARMIDEAADLYRQYLIPITQIIHSKGRSRIQEFADSFRLRKD